MFKDLITELRPRQWIKNFFVFAPLIFAKKFFDLDSLENSLAAFFCFCAVSSGVYLINDLVDLEADQKHPLKKNRPLAAGKIKTSTAIFSAILFLILGIGGGFFINLNFGLAVLSYLVLNLGYSWYFKKKVIWDVIFPALGFVIRVIAGAVAIKVVFSSWLLLCTFFLTLFLAIGKRKNEFLNVSGNSTRGVLASYSLSLLDQMSVVVLPSTLITYALYTFSSGHSVWLIGTIPFVLYGLFRYLLIVDRKQESDDGPTDDLLMDRPLQITVLAWVMVVLIILIKL
ncbi:MAG TPA: decaprenyl-phosphate phosphoribosyltransferase [Candidatus Magasanikbacteria bacterium]|nr:decaprenyl-phosphate phosphoribosyltransferase [Candidatus Magasanikbacteria bacterium]